MANEEHLAKLKEGVEVWNEWREKHPDLRPELQGADLTFAQLQGADLTSAQLQGAKLFRTKLQGATLGRATFDTTTALNDVALSDDKYGAVSVADIRWGGVNLAIVDWASLKILGDEQVARQQSDPCGEVKDRVTRLGEYQRAVRANRQLSVVLREQGMNEEAD